MRYIRTKNGIIDLDKYVLCHVDNDFYILKSKKHRKNGQDYTKLYKKFILKEADTIPELCDEFVLKSTFDGNDEYQNSKKLYVLRLSKIAYDNERKYLTEIYGAIWTTKGLIYVAKLNEEGDFKLL